ncbi:hypothetical protein ACFV6Y_39065 [Streptomyces massasporeus]|uniref:hypothetical protein n=1 Tax=Streptomyces massasporeus TaxID=67324 RepID=UPI003669E122
MLKIIIDNFENVAMRDDPQAAIGEILGDLAVNKPFYGPRSSGALFDANGNKVGRWELALREEDD